MRPKAGTAGQPKHRPRLRRPLATTLPLAVRTQLVYTTWEQPATPTRSLQCPPRPFVTRRSRASRPPPGPGWPPSPPPSPSCSACARSCPASPRSRAARPPSGCVASRSCSACSRSRSPCPRSWRACRTTNTHPAVLVVPRPPLAPPPSYRRTLVSSLPVSTRSTPRQNAPRRDVEEFFGKNSYCARGTPQRPTPAGSDSLN